MRTTSKNNDIRNYHNHLAQHAMLGPNRAEAMVTGAVKSNMGHLEAAAGLVGLLKLVSAVGQAAPSLPRSHSTAYHIRELRSCYPCTPHAHPAYRWAITTVGQLFGENVCLVPLSAHLQHR